MGTKRLYRILLVILLMTTTSTGLMNGQGYAALTTVDSSTCTVTESHTTDDTTIRETVDLTALKDIKKSKIGIPSLVGDSAPMLSVENFTDDNVVTLISSNNNPTAIGLSGDATVNQSAGTNALVGQLSSVDADSGDSFTYTLADGMGDTNNSQFSIGGTNNDQLLAINATTMPAGTYSVRIQTHNGRGGIFEKPFTIKVVDDVAPIITSLYCRSE